MWSDCARHGVDFSDGGYGERPGQSHEHPKSDARLGRAMDRLSERSESTDRKRCASDGAQGRLEGRKGRRLFADAHRAEICHPRGPEMNGKPLVEINSLTVELATPAGWVRPVNDVSLEIGAGESIGLVGESGSGKTMLSLALMGLLPKGSRVSGEISLGGKHLERLPELEWQRVRGREIAMIFQEPMTSLNPVMRVGAQIEEAIRAHEPKLARADLRNKVLDALRRAAVPEPGERAEQYPHQLSGGLRQRAMIAMDLSTGPKLLIADEPTTALDVTVQRQILELLRKLQRDLQLGLLFITHDLGVVAQIADRVTVLYAGRIVEQGPTREVLASP